MIKAIQTNYKGYRFRSRLEARWAVFFDAMGIEWVYEHQGYELPSGYYLPDFWLPKEKMHAEVKPTEPTAHEWQLCKELSIASGNYAIVLDGLPEPRNYWGWMYCESDPIRPVRDEASGKLIPYIEKVDFAFCVVGHESGHVWFIGDNDHPKREYLGWKNEARNYQDWPALKTCRAARFEHGEKPESIEQQMARLGHLLAIQDRMEEGNI